MKITPNMMTTNCFNVSSSILNRSSPAPGNLWASSVKSSCRLWIEQWRLAEVWRGHWQRRCWRSFYVRPPSSIGPPSPDLFLYGRGVGRPSLRAPEGNRGSASRGAKEGHTLGEMRARQARPDNENIMKNGSDNIKSPLW